MKTTRPTFAESEFRKATRSNPDTQCVRVARRDGWVELRDDKTTFGTANDHRLVFTAEEFDTYQTGVRQGQTNGLALEITHRAEDNMYVFRRTNWASIELTFTEAEVDAFHDGIAKHEFDTLAHTA